MPTSYFFRMLSLMRYTKFMQLYILIIEVIISHKTDNKMLHYN